MSGILKNISLRLEFKRAMERTLLISFYVISVLIIISIILYFILFKNSTLSFSTDLIFALNLGQLFTNALVAAYILFVFVFFAHLAKYVIDGALKLYADKKLADGIEKLKIENEKREMEYEAAEAARREAEKAAAQAKRAEWEKTFTGRIWKWTKNVINFFIPNSKL